MLEEKNNKLAYSNDLKVFHHHLKTLPQWISKWKRNYQFHFISNLKNRNLGWLFTKNFRLKTSLWFLYSLFPIFSGIHSIFLMIHQTIQDQTAH